MQGRPAKILNIASTAGITARPGWVAYAASKAAVVSLSQTLPTSSPGPASRSTASPRADRDGAAPQARARTRTRARSCSPSAVADVIATLMRDDERTLDGQNIIVRQQI